MANVARTGAVSFPAARSAGDVERLSNCALVRDTLPRRHRKVVIRLMAVEQRTRFTGYEINENFFSHQVPIKRLPTVPLKTKHRKPSKWRNIYTTRRSEIKHSNTFEGDIKRFFFYSVLLSTIHIVKVVKA